MYNETFKTQTHLYGLSGHNLSVNKKLRMIIEINSNIS